MLVWFKVSFYPVLIRFFALARGVTPPRPRLATGMLSFVSITLSFGNRAFNFVNLALKLRTRFTKLNARIPKLSARFPKLSAI